LNLTYEDLIELMPEWKGNDLRVDTLIGGITNKLYRVQLPDGRAYVVRLYGQKTEMFIDRDIEMRTIRQLEGLRVSPRLIKYLPERKVTIVEYIPGRPLRNEDFLREELLERIVRPIKVVHQSRLQLPRAFDPLKQVKSLCKKLLDSGGDYPEFDILGMLKILDFLYSKAHLLSSDFLPCHNDLLADNFILVGDHDRYREPIYLIDWEYAGMNTPYYEISDMFQEILVPKEIEKTILRIYWEDQEMEEHIFKTDLFKPFPDMYWFLWSLIQHKVSIIKFDYYLYGKTKYENACKNIQTLREHYGFPI
jgi:thiamine kinase-like enzyme